MKSSGDNHPSFETSGRRAPAAHPPDRAHIATEARHPRSTALHAMSIAELVELMSEADHEALAAVERARPALTSFIECAEPGFNRGGRIVYVGAGTSGRLGVLDASEAPPTFQVKPGRVVGIIAGGDAALRQSSEGLEDDPHGAETELARLNLTPDDAVIGIAAGGTTPYVLGGVDFVRRVCSPKALIALIVCTPIPRPACVDHLIVLDTGPEIITGSTRMKAGTATKLALNTISTALMIRSGRVYENLMVDLRATNDKLRDRAARIVMTLTGLSREEAFRLLDSAGGEVKTATVMQRMGVSRNEAQRRLADCDGRLDRALAPE